MIGVQMGMFEEETVGCFHCGTMPEIKKSRSGRWDAECVKCHYIAIWGQKTREDVIKVWNKSNLASKGEVRE